MGWLLSGAAMLTAMLGQYPFQQVDFMEIPLYVDALYDACGRVAWSISLTWIIVACLHGYGGFVTRFLSSSFWMPISRLSYCIYLVHFMLQGIFSGSIRSSQFITEFQAIRNFCGDFVIAFLAAILWSLAFEYPLMKFIKKRKEHFVQIPLQIPDNFFNLTASTKTQTDSDLDNNNKALEHSSKP